MMSAITTASSVCGWITRRRTTTMARMTAAATMPNPRYLPRGWRRSLILAPEEEEPRGEDPHGGEARNDQGRRAEIRRDLHRDEDPPGDYGEHQPDDDADQPRREERAQHVDGRRGAAAGEGEQGGAGERSASAADTRPRWIAGDPGARRRSDGRRRRCRLGIEHERRSRSPVATLRNRRAGASGAAREEKAKLHHGMRCVHASPNTASPATGADRSADVTTAGGRPVAGNGAAGGVVRVRSADRSAPPATRDGSSRGTLFANPGAEMSGADPARLLFERRLHHASLRAL